MLLVRKFLSDIAHLRSCAPKRDTARKALRRNFKLGCKPLLYNINNYLYERLRQSVRILAG